MLGVSALSGFGAGGGRTFDVVLATNTTDYDLAADLQGNQGWDGVSPVTVTVSVNVGVTVNASSTGTDVFTIDLPAGSKVTLVNQGSIIGRGGNGGVANSGAGGVGGTALSTTIATTIDNQGMVAGGRGSDSCSSGEDSYSRTVKGGEGGGGAGLGSGGVGLHPGQSGNQTAPGAGGVGDTCTSGCASAWSGPGGNGGALGLGGGNGSPGDNGGGGSAGAAGKYLAGASHVTWINVGDVRGPSS
jgi:hypothetical protein